MDEMEIVYSLWLTGISGIGTITANRLIDKFGSAQNVYHADSDLLLQVKGMNRGKMESVIRSRSLDDAEQIVESCQKKEIQIILCRNVFGSRLTDLGEDTPLVLYTRGQRKNFQHSVGIIGPRRCSQAVKQKTAEITAGLLRSENIIISGMAKGVDSYAHTVCINSGNYTIAVLANGLDICYPKEHELLMQSIAAYGLLISEYPPGTFPFKYYFPRRNRLIAALSDRLIVIAPGIRSGTGTTREYALKLGKKLTVIEVEERE